MDNMKQTKAINISGYDNKHSILWLIKKNNPKIVRWKGAFFKNYGNLDTKIQQSKQTI